MALVRWTENELSPWGAFRDLERQLNRVFGDTGASNGDRNWVPAIDIHESEDAFTVEVDIPGMKKEDIHIEVMDNVLTVRGERKSETEKKDKNYHRVERSYGSFARSVELPGRFNTEKVGAKFEDGVLKVTLPKTEDTKPRRISVGE